MKKFALVTGASRGIGFAYSTALLDRGYNVIGVSRNIESFLKLKTKYPDQEIIGLSADLSEPENVINLYENVKDYPIAMVINNAGFGKQEIFALADLKNNLNMVDLNIKHVQILTYCFLEKFVRQNFGVIINISSIVGFAPLPYLQTYAATKAFVLNFSTAINYELKAGKSPVRVITVCPGVTESNFSIVARGNNEKLGSLHDKLKKMPAAVLCNKSLDVIHNHPNKNVIVIGFRNKCVQFASKILPSKVWC